MGKIDSIMEVNITDLVPYEKNAKLHPEEQINLLCRSIEEYGFLNPCLIDKDHNVIAGHGRIEAAKRLGWKTIPCLYVEGLTEAQRKAYILADNRLTELGGWDMEIIGQALAELSELDFDITLTGFNLDEIETSTTWDDEQDAKINPVTALPESRVFVSAVSAFGTESERFIEIKLTDEEAERLLQKIKGMETGEIGERFRQAIHDI